MDIMDPETYRSRKLLMDIEETMDRSGLNKMITPRGSIFPHRKPDSLYPVPGWDYSCATPDLPSKVP